MKNSAVVDISLKEKEESYFRVDYLKEKRKRRDKGIEDCLVEFGNHYQEKGFCVELSKPYSGIAKKDFQKIEFETVKAFMENPNKMRGFELKVNNKKTYEIYLLNNAPLELDESIDPLQHVANAFISIKNDYELSKEERRLNEINANIEYMKDYIRNGEKEEIIFKCVDSVNKKEIGCFDNLFEIFSLIDKKFSYLV